MTKAKYAELTEELKRRIIQSMCPVEVYEMMSEDQRRLLDNHIIPRGLTAKDMDAGNTYGFD